MFRIERKRIRFPKKIAYPVFSDVDADLRRESWSLTPQGYARACHQLAHRVVGARLVNRDLTRLDVIDHISGDKLDNRRENIRVGTHQQNNQNSAMKSSNTSGCRGVSFMKNIAKWEAYISFNYKKISGGFFSSIHDARDKAAQLRRDYNFATGRFEEPSDAPAKLHRATEGTNPEDVAVQSLQLKPVHPKTKARPRLQGVS